jgi:hypothetical protein
VVLDQTFHRGTLKLILPARKYFFAEIAGLDEKFFAACTKIVQSGEDD